VSSLTTDRLSQALPPHAMARRRNGTFFVYGIVLGDDERAGYLSALWNQRSYEMPARPRALKRVFSDARVRLSGASASATFMAE
jgi:hypothetical protein